jgi:L-malate glycosyltransferase
LRIAFLSIGRHIHTERWIQWFAQRGHECHLLTVQPGEVEGVTVHDIRSISTPKPLHYALSLLKVKSILKKINPDILNTHFLTGYGYWGHFSGMHPNVLTVWGDDVYVTPYENSLKRKLAEIAMKSCDALTGDSTDILEQSVRDLGADPVRSFRVLWGVDFSVFKPVDANNWRTDLGFSEEDIVYFSPRSFTQPYYNIDTVINAAAQVMAKEPRARFLFAGYEGDPAPFWDMAKNAGIEDVTKFKGRIPHDQFATALAGSDVFISVPSVDATAVSLLEAMACSSAIIVSDLPSSTEWVEHGKSAKVVQPQDANALAQAMLEYAADKESRIEFGKNAMDLAHMVAGFDANMQYVDRIFKSLVDEDCWPEEVSLAKCRSINVD